MLFTFTNSVKETITAELEATRYINDNLGIVVLTTEPDEYGDRYYCDLTTNVAPVLPEKDMFYLDTNNAPQNLLDVTFKKGLYIYTGDNYESGFCIFPICQLTEKGKALLKL